MNTKKLTCGTFAKLCNTTKETLFHYDKIGLLKPEFIGKNNYRYYAPEQFFLFNFIETLTDSDTPLKEIKSQIKNFNADSFTGFIARRNSVFNQVFSAGQYIDG
ncbi:MerR family transcriptional regulator [Succinatimonas hippei]|uniref:MerR family transcriptional regulator n=1 Tax=Succinatimonas hippei TaxID=626938 RepID=UPI00255CD038|nr:MerR family transcriptional regulator [Succinatimonas hippei]